MSTTTSSYPPPPTTTTVACQNSYDSRCGDFRWDPEPQKDPLTINVSVLTTSPRAGQPVDFKVVVDDADIKIDRQCHVDDYGDQANPPGCQQYPHPCPAYQHAYGPWSPPEKVPDHYETTSSWTYQKPGTYTVSFTYRTVRYQCGSPADQDPYANEGTGTVTFTVGSAT